MIVKMFKGGGNAKSSADYLIGKEHDREGARELKGDIRLTQSIAEQADYSQQVTVGCLSFEEKNIPEKQKEELIDKFEQTFFAGLEKEDYSIAWIEHTDKDRLELNFYIANVELSSNKRLKPYFHKADFHLKDSFQNVINQEYGFSDPHNIEKRQLLRQDKALNKTAKEIQNTTHEFIKEELEAGNITSREEVIDLLDKAYGISRVTPEAISFKNPNGGRNIRLKGEFYSERFYKDDQGLSRDLEKSERSKETRNKESSGRDNSAELARYTRAIEIRKERNITEYKKDRGRSKDELELNIERNKREARTSNNTDQRESGRDQFVIEREQPINKKTDLSKINNERFHNNNIFYSNNSNGSNNTVINDIHEKDNYNEGRRAKADIVITEAQQRLSKQANRLSKYTGSGTELNHNERGFKTEQISDRGQERIFTVVNSQESGSTDNRFRQSNIDRDTNEEIISYEITREIERTVKDRAERIKENNRRATALRERIERAKQYARELIERTGAREAIKQAIDRAKQFITDRKQSIDENNNKINGRERAIDDIKSNIKQREPELFKSNSDLQEREIRGSKERGEKRQAIERDEKFFNELNSKINTEIKLTDKDKFLIQRFDFLHKNIDQEYENKEPKTMEEMLQKYQKEQTHKQRQKDDEWDFER